MSAKNKEWCFAREDQRPGTGHHPEHQLGMTFGRSAYNVFGIVMDNSSIVKDNFKIETDNLRIATDAFFRYLIKS
jgi:hypothetical protein